MLVLFVEWLERRPQWLVFSLWILMVLPCGIIERIQENIFYRIFPEGELMRGIKLELYTYIPLLQPVVWASMVVMAVCGVWGSVQETWTGRRLPWSQKV
jgi:hypothetical protein